MLADTALFLVSAVLFICNLIAAAPASNGRVGRNRQNGMGFATNAWTLLKGNSDGL
jgi:hypothetical protein